MVRARSGSSAPDRSTVGAGWYVAMGITAVLGLIAVLAIAQYRDSAIFAASDQESQGTVAEDAQRLDPAVAAELPRREKNDPTAMGRRDAPVVMIEYADYRCPFCAIFARETLPDLRKKYITTGEVRYERRDKPIYGDQSMAAAIAVRAAGQQGKYWPMHEAIYAAAPARGHPDLPRKKLIRFAQKAGVPDMAAFTDALDSPVLKKKVRADADEADRIGIAATPAFVINGRLIVGAQPESVFAEAFDEALDLPGR